MRRSARRARTALGNGRRRSGPPRETARGAPRSAPGAAGRRPACRRGNRACPAAAAHSAATRRARLRAARHRLPRASARIVELRAGEALAHQVRAIGPQGEHDREATVAAGRVGERRRQLREWRRRRLPPPCGTSRPAGAAHAARSTRRRALKRGEALEMVVGVAELLRDHGQAAEGVADLELLAHAHAAVQLHRLLADVAAASAILILAAETARCAIGGSLRTRPPCEQARQAIDRACS